MAFACLEVVLDRGQTEDWFESNFIVFFFVVAMAALVFAIFWEWRHPDPVVEIRLLGDRNFALANIFYFIFGFTLYGSTVLIPQMLQRLYGYTATDAGLVLGPGAFVIVTTLLARRTQYHQSVLVAHSTPFDERYRRLLANLTNYFGAHGFSHTDAAVHAQAQAFNLLERQATFLGFLDCFTALGWFVLMGVPLVFLIVKFRGTGASENH